MAIPENYIDRITDIENGDRRYICPAADKVRVDNDNFEGTDMDEVLDEIADAIDDAGSGGYAPPAGGIPKTDLSSDVQTSLGKADSAYQKPASGIPATDLADGVIPDTSNLATKGELTGKVDKETGKGLSTNDYTDADKAAVGTIGSKANAADVYTKAQTDVAIQDAVEDIEAGEQIAFDAGGTAIIDSASSPNADTVLAAASARWVKEIDNNVKAILAALAGMAFTGDRPTWQTVAKRTYTLSFGTLTGLDSTTPVSYANGDAAADDDTITEGYLKLILKPASSSYAFTSVQVNGKSVTATPVDGASDGSVYIEITVNDDVELSATASAGKSVSFESGNHCSFNENSEQTSTSVANNTDLSVSIYANKHYTLPSSITVKVGTSTLSSSNYTYTRATGNKTATLFIDKQHITDDITIDCDAVIMNSVEVAFSGSNVLWSDNNGNPVTSPLTLYEDDMPFYLHADPGSGYAMSQAPSITGTATNSFVADGDGYKLQIVAADTASPANELSISASVSSAYNITAAVKKVISGASWNGDSQNAELTTPMTIVTDTTTGCGLTNTSPVLSGGSYSGALDIASGFGVYDVKIMMGSTDITDSAYNRITKAISIASVTDDVTVEITVRETVNGVFEGVSYCGSRDGNNVSPGYTGKLIADNEWCCTPDFIEIPTGATDIRWVHQSNYDANQGQAKPSHWRTLLAYGATSIMSAGDWLTAYAANETSRDKPLSSWPSRITPVYFRASFNKAYLGSCALQFKVNGSWVTKWDGSEHVQQSNNE